MSPQHSGSPTFMLVSYVANFSTMKMEVTYSSEMSVGCQRITRRYIPDDRTLPYVDLTLPTSTFLGLNMRSDNKVRELDFYFLFFLLFEGLFIIRLYQVDKQSTKFTIWKY
jgi:hypothetical protein